MCDKSAPKCNCPTAGDGGVISHKSKSNPESFCCMKQRYWSMLRDRCFSDVCFVVGIEPLMQEIHAHRNVLSVCSSVFKTMFNKSWSRKSNRIEVPDIEPAVFFSLLRFIYTDDVELTADSVVKILYAAKKYAVIPLENLCSDFLKEQLCPVNACSVLTQAKLFDQLKLVESCLEEIDENAESAFMSDSFTSIDVALLRSILERDSLKISEVDLFDGVLRWSVAECQRRNLAVNADNQKLVLEAVTSLVRFPLMTQTEFGTKVLPLNLLSYEELVDLFQHFSDAPVTSSKFISTLRSSKELFVAERFIVLHEGWWSYENNPNDGIGFSFDQDVTLVGFGLYKSYNGLSDTSDDEDKSEDESVDQDEDEDEDEDIDIDVDGDEDVDVDIDVEGDKNEDKDDHKKYTVNITVKNEETGDILYQNVSTHASDDSENTYRVLLGKSIKLTANTVYAVITKIKGLRSIYGRFGKKTVCVEDSQKSRKVKVTFKNISFKGSHRTTNVSRGQIPEILFTW